MKDFSTTIFNLESRLVQKGIIDLKGFWQFVDEKYFKLDEKNNLDLLTTLNRIILKQSELPFPIKLDGRESKETQTNIIKYYEELHQEGFKTGKFIFLICFYIKILTFTFLFYISILNFHIKISLIIYLFNYNFHVFLYLF